MKLITKKECINNIKEEIGTKIFAGCIALIAGILSILTKPYYKNDDFSFIINCIIIGVLIIAGYVIYRIIKLKLIFKNNFYIVKDVVVDIKVNKPIIGGIGPKNRHYSFRFLHNGIYKISISGENTCSESDYIATTSSNVKDTFYLMIHKGEIIKCFNTKYYAIDENEFSFVDGIFIMK